MGKYVEEHVAKSQAQAQSSAPNKAKSGRAFGGPLTDEDKKIRVALAKQRALTEKQHRARQPNDITFVQRLAVHDKVPMTPDASVELARVATHLRDALGHTTNHVRRHHNVVKASPSVVFAAAKVRIAHLWPKTERLDLLSSMKNRVYAFELSHGRDPDAPKAARGKKKKEKEPKNKKKDGAAPMEMESDKEEEEESEE